MAVHLLHGCAPTWSPGQQTVRNYVPEAALRSYLKNLPAKYGMALSPDGPDVLTIDDATKGAGRAAAIAREYGHEVILFINPHQVMTGEPYYFSLFNVCLDNRRDAKVVYRGQEYDLAPGIRPFRLAAKRVLSGLEPQAALRHVAEIGELLNSGACEIPDYAQTLELGELLHLRDVGVTIENHGWAHRHIDALSRQQLIDDVLAAQRWLIDQIGVRANRYAIPFGETKWPIGAIEELAEIVFLADMHRPSEQVGDKTWNRVEITRGLQN